MEKYKTIDLMMVILYKNHLFKFIVKCGGCVELWVM